MEDFGDILFFLVAALFAIIGAVNRKKKGAQVLFPGTATEDEPLPEVPEKQVFRPAASPDVIFEKDYSWDDFNYEDDAERNPGKDFSDEQASIITPEPMAAQFTGEGVSALIGNAMNPLLTEIGDEISDEGLRDLSEDDCQAAIIAGDFDLRKAIIYSEFINRKDFS